MTGEENKVKYNINSNQKRICIIRSVKTGH